MNKAVAVVGMCGSGKSLLCEYFCREGWQKVYFGGVTMTQLKKAGQPINEVNERRMRENLRKTYGMGAFALLLKEEILQKFGAEELFSRVGVLPQSMFQTRIHFRRECGDG